MTITRFGVGPRMSQSVVHRDRVFLAGVIADDATVGVKEQTEQVLQTIDRRLATAGSDKTKILSVNIWLSDISTFSEFNAAWDAWVPQGHAPARATVEAKLAGANNKVEIMVQAAT